MTDKHSELIEWLDKIPPLPWTCSSAGIHAANGIFLAKIDPNSNLKLEEHGATLEYIAHCCTQLPKLLQAAEGIQQAFHDRFRGTGKVDDCLVEPLNLLHDEISKAKAEPFADYDAPLPDMRQLAEAVAKLTREVEVLKKAKVIP